MLDFISDISTKMFKVKKKKKHKQQFSYEQITRKYKMSYELNVKSKNLTSYVN